MNTLIHTPTIDLNKSFDFYEKLGFTVLSKTHLNLITDGHMIFELSSNRYARPGLKLYRENFDTILYRLEGEYVLHPIHNGYLLNDGNGLIIYFVCVDVDFPSIDKVPNAVLGNNVGLTIECFNFKRSLKLWKILGYKVVDGSEKQGWIVLNNAQGFSVSLMKPQQCPHLFITPSISYFNGKKNIEIIKKIKSIDIPIEQEITHFNEKGIVDNIILRDPGGVGFFIFND